jgi:hypothetical protein
MRDDRLAAERLKALEARRLCAKHELLLWQIQIHIGDHYSS